MLLTSKRNIKNILKKYQTHPSKGLGQHFLIDRGVIRKVIGAANLKPEDIVLEIGPGLGVLTQELAKKVKKVIAVEKDPKMIEMLKENLKDFKNVEIVKEDILKFKPQNQKGLLANYKVVGNLPFYLTAPVIRKFLELLEARPLSMVLMVQKEVGQRICARPPKMNLLAVSVQFYAEPEIISYISKKSFWPQPKVDSAIIKLKVKKQKIKVDKHLFFKIVKAGFSQPRKQIINNLSKGLKIERGQIKKWLSKNNIQPTQRAETLSINNWGELTRSYQSY